MSSRSVWAYAIAPVLLLTIVLLWLGFWTGFFLTIHGGIAYPIVLLGFIAVIIILSVYTAAVEWRAPSTRIAQTVATLPLAALFVAMAFMVYRISAI